MRRFRDLSIGGKITVAVGVVVLLQVVIALAGLYFIYALDGNLDRIVERDAEKIMVAARLNRNLVELELAAHLLPDSTGPSAAVEHLRVARDRHEKVRQRLAELRKLSDAEDKKLLSVFERDYRVFEQKLEHMEQLAANHRIAELSAALDAKTLGALGRASAVLRKVVDRQDAGLHRSKAASDHQARLAVLVMLILAVVSTLGGLGFGLVIARGIAGNLERLVSVANAIAEGRLDEPVEVSGRDEVGKLGGAVESMQAALLQARQKSDEQAWLKSGLVAMNDAMRGDTELGSLASKIVREAVTALDGQVGAFYSKSGGNGEAALTLLGSYAFTRRKNLSNRYLPGEGLVGQAALEGEPIVLRNVPDDYIKVTSGLGEASPRFISVTPLVHEERVKGVLEIGTLGELTDLQLAYLEQAAPSIAITLEAAQSRQELARSLERAQQLTEELQAQQEELRASNEELEEQTRALQDSEERLKAQQEEMEVINEELEEKNELLERQKRDVEVARRELAERAEDLALASKYKSEFLANMSHELRTPLNSLLILARVFAENRDGNLSGDQVESARVIYNSGTELLGLISDILDLAKIEAGRMDVQLSTVRLTDLEAGLRDSFMHMAEDKGLTLEVSVAPELAPTIRTDRKRLDQVLRNLMSNALKFTEEGRIEVVFGPPSPTAQLSRSGLSPSSALSITVQDTGIGVPLDQQKVIFEAFQQGDGSTARRYGGTGLGLSITRELVQLLGGEIQLHSEPGVGSTFTVYLPLDRAGVSAATASARLTRSRRRSSVPLPEPVGSAAAQQGSLSPVVTSEVTDDRDNIQGEDVAILIVDDDLTFAKVLADQCHDKGLKSLIALSGEEGLQLAEQYRPRAIILDLRLPGIDGWSVLELLKDNPETRHIPVHIMSVEEARLDALRKGAIGFLQKPPDREQLDDAFFRIQATINKAVKRVLVVEDDAAMRKSVIALIGDTEVQVEEASSGQEALDALVTGEFDCVVLDLGLPDMDGATLLQTLQAETDRDLPPVVVYTGRDVTREQELELREFSESIIVKDVRSEERLMDEVTLFLHSVVSDLPERKKKVITDLHDVDRMFRDKRVLVVDDDMRTLFAVSKILTAKGIQVLKAEDGQAALSLLQEQPDVDLVLMDIMMPVMDGFETMRRIRAQERLRDLPIIALTAKAMMGDQEQCIAAGASDYLSKPIDESRLFSMMRVWLYR